MKILFVCLGNICRSPIAEGVMQHLVIENKLDWVIKSNGTNGFHTGEAPHKSSQKVCMAHGYDISTQRAARFSVADFDYYDKIFVMAKDVYNDVQTLSRNQTDMQKVDYFLNLLYPEQNMDVTDPWYGDEAGYMPVFLQIEKACKKLLVQ
jgi:protein-tyrosine phosphatase